MHRRYPLPPIPSEEVHIEELFSAFAREVMSLQDADLYQAFRYYRLPNVTPYTYEEVEEVKDVCTQLKRLAAASDGRNILRIAARNVYEDLRIEYIKHLDNRTGNPALEIKTLYSILDNMNKIIRNDHYPLSEIEELLQVVAYEEKYLYFIGKLLFFISLAAIAFTGFLFPCFGSTAFVIGAAVSGVLLASSIISCCLGQYKGLARSLSNFISEARSPNRVVVPGLADHQRQERHI